MIKRSVRVRLEDMLEAIDGCVELVRGKSFEDYQRNFGLRRAVERCVEIVSEASRHLPEALKDKHPESNWPEIRAIGNFLRHEYQRVDDLVIWRVATRYFPDLRTTIIAMLSDVNEQ